MINFYAKKWIYYCISLSLLLIGVVGFFINGVKLDITFSGGAKLTYNYTGEEIDPAKVETLVNETLKRDSTCQNAKAYDTNETSLVISLAGTESLSADDQNALYKAITKEFSENKIEQGSTTNVEASIGHRFFTRGLIAIGLAALFIIGYVSFRFSVVSGFTAALTALIALFHDIAMIFSVFIIFNIPINDGFIAVVLTILGYSINDTLVIFDRIRENKRLSGNKLSIEALVNTSIKQSLRRTINTSLMSLAAIILIMIFGYLKGIDSIVNFALPMMIGILSGCYSSSFLAPTLWCTFKKSK